MAVCLGSQKSVTETEISSDNGKRQAVAVQEARAVAVRRQVREKESRTRSDGLQEEGRTFTHCFFFPYAAAARMCCVDALPRRRALRRAGVPVEGD